MRCKNAKCPVMRVVHFHAFLKFTFTLVQKSAWRDFLSVAVEDAKIPVIFSRYPRLSDFNGAE